MKEMYKGAVLQPVGRTDWAEVCGGLLLMGYSDLIIAWAVSSRKTVGKSGMQIQVTYLTTEVPMY